MEKEIKKVKEENKAKVVQTPTQYADVVELPDGRVVDSLELLVEIYNSLTRIEKGVL